MSADSGDGRDGPSVDGIARRTLLASLGVLGTSTLTGCLSGAGEETTLHLGKPDAPSMGVAALGDTLRADQRSLIQEATTGQTATAYGYQPFEDVEYAHLAETYYRIRTEDVGAETVEKPVLVITQTTDAVDAVPLTEYDGHVVELIDPLIGDSNPQTLVLHPDMRNFDSLHPEPQHEYVTREDATYRLTVENRQVEQQGWRVEATAVATAPREFRTHLREDRIDETLTPTEFSEPARDIFQEAITDEYQEESPYSDGFETVLDAVETGLEADDTRRSVWLIVYDETLYRAQVDTVAWG